MRTSRGGLALALALGVLPAAASAADSDLSIEYGFDRITNGDGLNLPIGLATSVGVKLADSVALAGDFRWNHKSEEGVGFNLMSFQAGPRFVAGSGGTRFYLQVVAGGTRASAMGSSETKFSLMPGLGVDFALTDAVAFRVGGDVRFVFLEGEDQKDLLAHAGIVFRFGRR